MRRVRVLATGGTIASRRDPATGAAAPALTGAELLGALPELGKVAEVEAEQIANVASQALDFPVLLAVAGRIREVFARGEADGVVVTQGTMTMEETSWLWDLVLDVPGPVVVTGAMRHTSLPGTDGARNLLDAVTVAAAPAVSSAASRAGSSAGSWAARGLGVVVVMNGEIHAAREVVKADALALDAFRSPGLGPLGFVRSGRAELHRTPLGREHVPAARADAVVRLVTSVLGDDGALIDRAVEGADGLVLELMGGGAVPPPAMPAVRRVAARVPVIGVTRCHTGSMYEHVYGIPGGDVELGAAGVVFGGSLTGPKARVKLILCLGAWGADRGRVEAAFANV